MKRKRKHKTQFAGAMVSDQGPENPKLGNRGPRRGQPSPPTSGFQGEAIGMPDYFRAPDRPIGSFPIQPDLTITPERVTQSVRMRWNPIRGLTPERLVSYLDQWRLGFFRQAGMMWDAMERRDYQLQIVAPKRKKCPARHGYEVLTLQQIPTGQETLAEQQREELQSFFDNCTVTTALNPDEQGGFSLLLRQMMDSVGKYYAVHEIVWQPRPDGTLTAKFIFCPIWWFEGTKGKLRFLQSEFQIYGINMDPGEWLVTCGDGIMEACSVVYLFKHLPIKSWLSFLDKFGMPGIHGQTDAQKGSKEWVDFRDAVAEFAEEFATVTNKTNTISLIEAKTSAGSSGAGYDLLVEKMDRAITQLWRGADLGTQSSKNATGASLQEDESEILETDDNKVLEETLTAQICRFVLAWKFGPDVPQLAYIKLRTTPRQNLTDDVMVDKFLLVSGAPLAVKSTLERYGRPVPDDDEELLSAPAAPLPGEPAQNGQRGIPSELANILSPEFDKAALHNFLGAVSSDLQPIVERLDAIMKITDPAVMRQRLMAFIIEIDHLKSDISQDPSAAHALNSILGTALANGLTVRHKTTASA